MDASKGNVSELWQQKFKIVKKGLDQAQVFSFISNLIDQNNELASKVEHIDSLKKLAEKTIIEADKYAEGIKIEIEEEANAKAASIISEAEEKSKAEAERIIAEAQQSRAELHRMIAEAAERAKAGADRVIADVEDLLQAETSSTEPQAPDILADTKKRVEESRTSAQKRSTKPLLIGQQDSAL